ncbi:MAG: 1-acyl-sn-glycerol-3-phosphate acyltransferase [Planctomycetota bacterium]|nr:MAG: 1-acyl-sn-glycerol-3-phosphate acyltransferase [Planctomycetota bacterium]
MANLRAALRLGAVALWTLLLLPLALPVLALRPLAKAASLQLGAWTARLWSRGVLAACGVRRVVEGPRPPRGAFVACTHHGYMDILLLTSCYSTNFVAKREIAYWPVFGPLSRLAGTLFVDRERKSDTVRMRELLLPLLRRGLTITIFPEGGAGPGASVRPFKPPLFEAAAALGVPCVPAALDFATPGARDPGPQLTVCWWQPEPLHKHVWRLLRLPRVQARVRFGAPVSGLRDRKALAGELQRRVEALFVPTPK